MYASETASLAALEVFVHLPSSLLPVDLVLVEVRVPKGVAVEEWRERDLPTGWRSHPAPLATQSLGSDWVRSGRALLLYLPSAVLPQERIVLINPGHPDVRRLEVRPPVPFRFDPRMVKR